MDLKQETERENAAVGTLGALLGALAGLACIVPVGRLDIIAAVSGLLIGIFAVKEYEKLAGALGKRGAVISCVVVLFMTYPAHHLNVTIRVTEEPGMSFPDAFLSIPKLLQLDILNGFDFLRELAHLYLFAAWGAALCAAADGFSCNLRPFCV